jgi:iron complex transport system ATP-binding protein
MEALMFDINQVNYKIGDHTLLHQVSLTSMPGEIFGLLGPNGAGKSTLLHLLAGDLLPTSGAITFEGRPLKDWCPLDLARRRAVMPQRSLLGFNFSCLDVVLMGRHPHLSRSSRESDLWIAKAAMGLTEVEHLAEAPFPGISGGEAQRVCLARSIAQIWEVPKQTENRWLLLDEPTANLDPKHQQGVLKVARHLARQGVGVLIVLHDLNLAATFCDRIALLQQGTVAAIGAPCDVLTPGFVQQIYGIETLLMDHPKGKSHGAVLINL